MGGIRNKVYLSPEDVEEEFGFKKRTLQKWRSEGRGPAYTKYGKYIRYNRERLEAWMERYQVMTSDDDQGPRQASRR